MFETELAAYERQRDELLGTAEGHYVLIKGEEVFETYESQLDAIDAGYRRFGNVPFLVKQIVRFETPVMMVSDLLAL